MFRKLSALMFIAVMTLLITLKHPVLGYCLCIKSYFASHCLCETVKPICFSPDDTTSCGGCCSDSEEHPNTTESPTPPCDDCSDVLLVDTGDFLWHGTIDSPTDSESEHTSATPTHHTAELNSALAFNQYRTRAGPPPYSRPASSTPLFLRHQNLRL